MYVCMGVCMHAFIYVVYECLRVTHVCIHEWMNGCMDEMLVRMCDGMQCMYVCMFVCLFVISM